MLHEMKLKENRQFIHFSFSFSFIFPLRLLIIYNVFTTFFLPFFQLHFPLNFFSFFTSATGLAYAFATSPFSSTRNYSLIGFFMISES